MHDFWSVVAPNWFVALGTVALATIAFLSIVRDGFEKKRLRAETAVERDRANAAELASANERLMVEERARKAEELRRRRAQAELVVAWPDDMDLDDPYVFAEDQYMQGGRPKGVYVRNDSNLPITNVQISWCYYGEGATGVHSVNFIEIVPPRSQRGYVRPHSLDQQPTLPIELTFNDARGRGWKQTRGGELQELT